MLRKRSENTECVKLYFMAYVSSMAICFLLPLWHILIPLTGMGGEGEHLTNRNGFSLQTVHL